MDTQPSSARSAGSVAVVRAARRESAESFIGAESDRRSGDVEAEKGVVSFCAERCRGSVRFAFTIRIHSHPILPLATHGAAVRANWRRHRCPPMKDISLLIPPLLRPWLFGVFFVLFLVVGIAFAYAVVL